MSRGRSIGVVLVIGLGVLLLIGCVESPLPGSAERYSETRREQIKQTTDYPDSPGQASRVVVPFFPDGTDQCGPATLASVLTYWGIPSEPAALKMEMYRPQLGGTLPIDFLLTAEARGLQAEVSSGTLERLKAELDAHHPVIALLNLGWVTFPQGHYVVAPGITSGNRGSTCIQDRPAICSCPTYSFSIIGKKPVDGCCGFSRWRGTVPSPSKSGGRMEE